MNVNINHPTFISFIDTVNKNVLSNISTEKYFSLTGDKKTTLQYLVLKLVIKSVKVRAKLTDSELSDFIKILTKKNEELENYEFSAILNDILGNFEALSEMAKNGIKKKRTIKTDEPTDA